jgi:hypothetical protein
MRGNHGVCKLKLPTYKASGVIRTVDLLIVPEAVWSTFHVKICLKWYVSQG